MAAARVRYAGHDLATCFGAQRELASDEMEIHCHGSEEASLSLPPNARVDVSWSVEMLVHGDRIVSSRTIDGEARGVLLGRAPALL